MFYFIRLDDDLVLKECENSVESFKTLNANFTFRFDVRQLHIIGHLFFQNKNLIFSFPSDNELFYSVIKNIHRKDSHTYLYAKFDSNTGEYYMNGLDKNVNYMVTDIAYQRADDHYLFIAYSFDKLNLYGSASTHFRNQIIDDILKEL